ncbi:MAG: TIGR03984 family CRISPR-associated protein [Planctomycetaceae bacterium]|nr:TIGR03984 family CRISPR-associated protein [Planctomycetaceae bacterium]
MKRSIDKASEVMVEVTDLAEVEADVRAWLEAHAKDLSTLLALSDDGVIWGYRDGGKLATSGEGSCGPPHPPLRAATLQWARVFGEAGELYLWRTSDGWGARRVRTASEGETSLWSGQFDEDQILWGTHATPEASTGFSKLTDGSEGLAHLVPLPNLKFEGPGRRLRLQVRHYLTTDDYGAERVAASRLVALKEGEDG